jgi:hypothetical protein
VAPTFWVADTYFWFGIEFVLLDAIFGEKIGTDNGLKFALYGFTYVWNWLL